MVHKMLFVGIPVALGVIVLVFQLLKPYLYLAPDSFTYFVMARQVWDAGLWFSYSGIDHTTGTHPGYYFLTALLFPLFELNLPMWSFVINAILIGIGITVLYRSFGLVVGASVLVLALTIPGLEVTNNGMESGLLFLALCLLAPLISRQNGLTERQMLLIGLLSGFAVLARLDAVFIVVAIYGWLFFTRIRAAVGVVEFLRPFVLSAVPFLALLAPVCLVYYSVGGSIMPISGELKSTFPYLSHQALHNLVALKLYLAAIVLAGGYLLWRREPHGLLIPSLLSATVVMYVYNALFVVDIGAWYGTLPFFLAALVIGFSLEHLYATVPRRELLAVVSTTLASIGIVYMHATFDGEDWVSPHKEATAFLNAYATEREAAAELKDGVFAFYSDIPVYSLTGLANNREYIDAVRADIRPYLEKKNISYIIGGDFGSGVQVPGATETFRNCSNQIYDMRTVRIYTTTDCIGPDN